MKTQLLSRLVLSRLAILGVALCAVAGAYAQSDTLSAPMRQRQEQIRDTRIAFFSGGGDTPSQDSIDALLHQFYMDQFRHVRDPKSPYFMFMSKDAQMAMGIGGTLGIDGWFDWNGDAPDYNFSPMGFAYPKDPANMRSLGASVHATKIYYTVIGRNRLLGNFTAYIEGGFSGYKGVGFKLKKAYFKFGDFTIGRTTSTFCDPASQAPTVDAAGANGTVSRSNILARWVHTWRKHYTVGVGVEIPKSNITVSNHITKATPDYIPDLVGLAQYSWDKGESHIRLSGLYRSMGYRDLQTARNRLVPGWAVQASSVWQVSRPFTLYAAAAYGEGSAGYINDLGGNPLDLLPDPQDASKLYAPGALGLSFGAQYYVTPTVHAALTLSQLNMYERSPVPAQNFRYGQYGALTLLWDVTPRLECGVEYLAGRKVLASHATAVCNRVDASIRFAF